MNNKIKCIVVILLIPLVVISFVYKSKTNFLKKEQKEEKQQIVKKEQKVLKLLNNGVVEKLDLESYIVGVVSCEMPASFEIDALKAQAVASRTYALKRMNNQNEYDLENSTNNQCYITEEQRKQKWNNNFEKYNNKIIDATKATTGQILTYNNEIIDAFYFAKSNGYTEDVANVFSESQIPYLVSVSSPWDTETTNYINQTSFTFEEFLQKLNLPITNQIDIKILERSKTNRVNKIEVNGTVFKGTQFRKLLNIKSTDFEIQKNQTIDIITKGYGHGVGMSQYGAQGLAKEGKTYKEILEYFYVGTEIKNV